jgi:hypothetical protein
MNVFDVQLEMFRKTAPAGSFSPLNSKLADQAPSQLVLNTKTVENRRPPRIRLLLNSKKLAKHLRNVFVLMFNSKFLQKGRPPRLSTLKLIDEALLDELFWCSTQNV